MNNELVEYLMQFLRVSSEISRKLKPILAYGGFEDFVLRNGKLYTEISDINIYGDRNHCFCNATRLVNNESPIKERFLEYCEGYAVFDFYMRPELHAWALEGDKVVECTIREAKGAKFAYFGVRFSREYLNDTLSKRGGNFGLIENIEMDYPLIKGAHTAFSPSYSTSAT